MRLALRHLNPFIGDLGKPPFVPACGAFQIVTVAAASEIIPGSIDEIVLTPADGILKGRALR